MAKIFRQRDIDLMEASDITQEFVDYYNRFSEERKEAFAENRPDLAEAILTWVKNDSPSTETDIAEADDISVINDDVYDADSELGKGSYDLTEISKNVYEGQDLRRIEKNDFRPVEALVIDDNKSNCPAHRTHLDRFEVSFHKPNGDILGRYFYYCPKCNRLFIKRSQLDINNERLDEWGVPHKFYDYDLSKQYLDSQTVPYEITDEEKIYVPDVWLEENPTCPIHNCGLDEITCIRRYKSKEINFKAFYCDQCDKVILRRASAINLEDQCAEIGIPLIEYEELAKKTPKKAPIPKREIKPDYYIDNGIRSKYEFDKIQDCYKLTEEDTVVVSDSSYCTHDGHDTKTVLGFIWVKERSGERKSYLTMLGYCAECQKYYMDEVDYKTIYNIGRPEVTVIIDVDDNSYMISSGEVFNIENDHLQKLEDEITYEIDGIHNSSDYVNPYETLPYYDDRGLAYRKANSFKMYDGKLEELFDFRDQPYQYRVDICADGETEVYYVGSSDINLGGERKVISSNSKFGRELIHYKTIKVKKEGKEFDIKLSRQFDIKKAILYGYANLRTDEDIIFRSGITDPFLVRVLNMRRRQHNLIDIFVTIQENQNRIVDAKFEKSLIVQGCAGSGKTMVLLHRLSSLKYNMPWFDFSRDALILTPNEQFTLHIKGLAESLQIGSIRRLPIEKYYAEVLSAYSDDLKHTEKITSEMLVRQDFVDYIYSDDFKEKFDKNYSIVIDELKNLVIKVESLLEDANEKTIGIDYSENSKIASRLKIAIESLASKVKTKDVQAERAQEQLNDLIKQKEILEKDTIPNKITETTTAIKDSVLSANTKVLSVLSDIKKEIDENNNAVKLLQTEREDLKTDVVSLKEANSADVDVIISNNQEWIDDEIRSRIEEINKNREELNENYNTQKLLEVILSNSYDDILSGKEIADGEITALQNDLTNERQSISEISDELNRVETARIVIGKRRRISRIQESMDETQKKIDSIQDNIKLTLSDREAALDKSKESSSILKDKISNEALSVIKAIINKKQLRVSDLNRRITRLSSRISSDDERFEGLKELLDQQDTIETENETIDWLKRLSNEVPVVGEELALCNSKRSDLENLRKAFDSFDERIPEAEQNYVEAVAEKYSDSIVKRLSAARQEIIKYSTLSAYQMVFDMTTSPVKDKLKIKSITGKLHRYDLYAQLLFAMKHFRNVPHNYKFICVDEGQDLAINEYRLLTILNNNDVVFNIFGDTNQLIKSGRGIKGWDVIKNEFKADEYTLNENYRNTNQITRFCNDNFNMDMLQTGVDGAKVREITVRELQDELLSINTLNERIAILIPRRMQKASFINDVLIEDKIKSIISDDIINGKIALMYVDEVKGIEFDKAFVVPDHMGRNEKYIAYTRPLSELIIVVDKDSIGFE